MFKYLEDNSSLANRAGLTPLRPTATLVGKNAEPSKLMFQTEEASDDERVQDTRSNSVASKIKCEMFCFRVFFTVFEFSLNAAISIASVLAKQ